MSQIKDKKKLLVICYPINWHWALSIEFLNREMALGQEYDILDVSFVGEYGIRKFVKKIIGGSSLQRNFLRIWKKNGVKVFTVKDNLFSSNLNISKTIKKLSEIDLESAGDALNTIAERTGNLKPTIQSDSKIINQEFLAMEKVKLVLSQFDLSNYSNIVTVNGRFTKNAVVIAWARNKKLPTKLIEFGSSKTKFEVYESSPQSVREIEIKINDLWNSSNLITREAKAKKHLEMIVKNSGLSDIDWRSSMRPGEAPVKGPKKICTFFSSTELEFIGVGDRIPDDDFQNQVEAFNGLVALLDKDQWDIYLRMHPNNPSNKVQGAESFIWEEYKSNKHITMIDSDSTVDSLELGRISDLVASYGSNIAMEFVARGMQNVITLGPAPWNRLLPKFFLPNSPALLDYLNHKEKLMDISSIYPWAFFVSSHGTDFKLLKFNKIKSNWYY